MKPIGFSRTIYLERFFDIRLAYFPCMMPKTVMYSCLTFSIDIHQHDQLNELPEAVERLGPYDKSYDIVRFYSAPCNRSQLTKAMPAQ